MEQIANTFLLTVTSVFRLVRIYYLFTQVLTDGGTYIVSVPFVSPDMAEMIDNFRNSSWSLYVCCSFILLLQGLNWLFDVWVYVDKSQLYRFCCVRLQLIAQAMPSRHTFFKALANGQEAVDDKVSSFM